MGFGGFGIAIAVLFLLVYCVPYAMRTRQMMIDAPLDERYEEDLRMIRIHTRTPSDSRGRIFLTERTMAPTQPQKLREAARDRSRARARMATRRANQIRGSIIGGTLALITVGAWVVVALTTTPAWLAIIATVLTGGYTIGFGYLLTVMAQADGEDRERIDAANEILRSLRRPPARTSSATRKMRDVASDAGGNVTAPVTTAERKAAEERPATSAERAPIERRVTQHTAPSYTVKRVTKRTVTPYAPPSYATADTPFRPTAVGQRIGDEKLEAAHEAPAMTGQEELRSDVLGGGSTLDALLERRRA